ncbi:MAG: NAD(P)-dependent dehydrogenase (short-subunit alcohol dehydrogenase family) [Paracoccaceae bacterium]|jgi:NAD(P)-dependent dehydrogenase (short-subunit alcohol dehydrogenase family)
MRTLITGASRGIGLELAQQMDARGDDVIATTRGAMPDDDIDWRTLDVTDDVQLRMLAASINDPIDLLICNAGILRDKGQVLEDGFPAAQWAETFAVNATGVFLTVQAFLANLRQAKAPKIAIISSQMGSSTRANGGSYMYRASKAAAVNIGRNLATDLAGDAIAVGIYHPGWVQTDMGGPTADLVAADAAIGLIQRFDTLCMATTGCFETWDGRAHAL